MNRMLEPIPPSSFTEDFVNLNFRQFKKSFHWFFLPGMLFRDSASWWKKDLRLRRHEGVDFCYYYAADDPDRRQVGAARVPSLFEGEVVKTEKDFLATTVWMRHGTIRRGNAVLFSALAHVEPFSGVTTGKICGQGEAVAEIAQQRDFFPMSMHLHVTLFWAPHFLDGTGLGWRRLHKLKEISFVDPLQVICLRP